MPRAIRASFTRPTVFIMDRTQNRRGRAVTRIRCHGVTTVAGFPAATAMGRWGNRPAMGFERHHPQKYSKKQKCDTTND